MRGSPFTTFSSDERFAGPVLLGAPYDGGVSFERGPAAAPGVIRTAITSDAGNLWSEQFVDLGRPNAVRDAGDVSGNANSPAAFAEAIADAVASIVRSSGIPIMLGGDHTVTLGALRGFQSAGMRPALVVVDAHPDLYPELDGKRDTHASWCRRAIEEGLVSQVTQIGIRAMTGAQRDEAERLDVRVIGMSDWSRGVRPSIGHPTYLSIDVDGFDPAHAPAVSHPEAGGLGVREILEILPPLGAALVGADIVEFNPTRDRGGLTAQLCAKLFKELAASIIIGRR